MQSKPGTYVLVLHSEESASVQIGKWGQLDIYQGYYAYVGSALGPGGVLARVSRHCRLVKSKHWHIDYLRERLLLVSVWYNHSSTCLEHRWAGTMERLNGAKPVKGFGCSDCNCESHLYFFTKEPELAEFASAVKVTIKPWFFEGSG